MRQIEVAVDVPVDHSLVSRWETGAVLPTRKDVDRICVVLALDEEQEETLRYAWQRERNSADADEDSASGTDWTEFLQISVEGVRALRKSGQPRMALMLSRRDAIRSLDFLRSHPWRAGHGQALGFLSELLLEECKAGLDYLPKSSVRGGQLGQTLRAQALAVTGATSANASLFHAIATEGVEYVSGNFGDAHELSRRLLTSHTGIPSEWVPEVVRACAINSGKVADAQTLSETESAFNKLLDERGDLPPGTQAFVLEGFARGWAGVEPRRAIEVIERAWQTRNSSNDSEALSALRFVQLVRSQVEVQISLRDTGNTGETLRNLEKAIEISRRNQYEKYSLQLEMLAHQIT
jgi:hypothetical protein